MDIDGYYQMYALLHEKLDEARSKRKYDEANALEKRITIFGYIIERREEEIANAE